MQELARFAYAFGLVAVVTVLVWSGWWRRLPVFAACLCCMSIIAVTYTPESRPWISAVYLRVEPIAVLLRLAAAGEITLLLTAPAYRFRLMIGLTLVSAAVTLAVWRLDPGSDVFTFVQIRRYVQIASAVWMVVCLGVFWAAGAWPRDQYGLHAVILAVLLVKQAAYSLASFGGWTYAAWFRADWPGLLITFLCCLLWLLLFRRVPREA